MKARLDVVAGQVDSRSRDCSKRPEVLYIPISFDHAVVFFLVDLGRVPHSRSLSDRGHLESDSMDGRLLRKLDRITMLILIVETLVIVHEVTCGDPIYIK